MDVRILKLTIIFHILFSPLLIYAQTAQQDTTKTPFARPDTLKTRAVKSKLFWYNLDQDLKQRDDLNAFDLYKIDEERDLISTDLSDVFRTQALWHDYDLFEGGRPAYLGGINKLPHQTAVFYDGVIVNDLIHGMYNLQFVPVMFTQRIEATHTRTGMRNFGMTGTSGINIISNSMHTKAPWTRILYKQGSFGYSDIDISFVQPVTEYLSLQLGGINKFYDGTYPNADYHGTNYRGELTWQYNSNLFLRGQFFINRQRTGLTAFDFQEEILFPRYIEWRDDYFIDVTWQPHDSTKNRLHVSLWNTYTFRRLKNRLNPVYVIKSHAKQYALDANYLFTTGDLELLSGTGVQYPQIHGTAYIKNYAPYRAQLYSQLRYPLSTALKWHLGLQVLSHKKYNPQVASQTHLELKLSDNQVLRFGAERCVRFPTASELYFNFDTLYGNQSLSPENHISLHTTYDYQDSSLWALHVAGGYSQINNEIQWNEPLFENRNSWRTYFYGEASFSFAWWKFDISAGGHATFADVYLTPRRSLWAKIHYHDVWLSGALILDAYGAAYFYDKHRNINFESRLDRFYPGSGETNAFYTLSWKIVATVQSAEIFYEMDNPLSEYYYFVRGYPEQYIRWRFGVNWILWD